MAPRRQPLIGGLLPGCLAAALLVAVALLAFGALWFSAPATDWRGMLQDRYLWHVLGFSFWQALLSALLSALPAIPLARALYRRRFPGRSSLLRLCAMTLVLPVLVAVFGILTVYGRSGWLAQLCQWLGIPWTFTPYGLQGILLAHVFFNLPLATRLLLQALEQIPGEQRQLAAQLGLRGWAHFRIVEWPWLKRQLLPAGALIFMLCFASFATVLSLGGGPQATTIELAIFQALSFDYDPGRAALLAVVVSGVNQGIGSVLQQAALWQATFTSLRIALAAGLLSVVLTVMLLWSSRELRLRQRPNAGQLLELSGMLILAMPGIVLASGFFLLLNATTGLPDSADGVVIFTNALMAIPYAIKVLEHPLRDIAERYNRLCLSLDIRGWNRLRLIELRALRRPLAQALAFACVLSIGDFGAVALFGNEGFRTLPFYLYQQIGSYRSSDGAVTALLLLLLCFLLFTLIEKLAGRYDRAD